MKPCRAVSSFAIFHAELLLKEHALSSLKEGIKQNAKDTFYEANRNQLWEQADEIRP